MSAATPDTAPQGDDDRAWVSIETPLSPADLGAFIADDLERLYRINPLLVVEAFERVAPGRFRARWSNLSNGTDLDTELRVEPASDGIDIHYARGLKRVTRVRVGANGATSRLIVTDDYSGHSQAERQARLAEVDRSLNAWGRALYDYLNRWARWRWLPPWRWYMRRVWQPMTPSARRIVFLILAISIFEVVTVAVVLLVWLAIR